MLWFYRFLSGFLTVQFYGDFSEKVLNICAKNRVSLWNSRCVKRKIICNITVRDFLKLRKILKGTKIRCHIINKSGIPFITRKYKNRIGLIIGFVLFIFFLEYMSTFIWTINVEGNKRVKKEEIINQCNNIGIYEGVKKNKIHTRNQKDELLLNTDYFAWASLNIEESVLTVNVSEIRNITEDNTIPTNLKSNADGIIEKIDISSGNSLVKVGDTVASGDILVSGIIERQSGTKFVHSIGTITAKTERVIISRKKIIKEEKVFTGKEKTKSVFSFFGLKIPLYLGKEKGLYISENNVSQVKLFNKNLPIRVSSKKFKFYKLKKTELSDNQVNEELEKDFKKQLNKLKITNYDIINKTIESKNDEKTQKVVITSQENIAIQDKLIYNSGN